MPRLIVVSLALVLATAVQLEDALAQYNVPSQTSSDSRVVIARDERDVQIAEPAKPTPKGWELGASLDFLTTNERSFRREKLDFTDVVLFHVHALVNLGARAELFGGVDLLPKQPSFSNELKWQGALAGVRARFTRTVSAYARGQVGPNLARDGYWTVGEAALQYRRDLAERVLFWESALGGTYTQLFLDEQSKRFFQTELLAMTGIAIREKKGVFAMWLNFGFHFPIVGRPTVERPDPTGRALDPQVRVGTFFGMLVGVNRGLDLFLEASILDRGDFQDAATTLPILAGGFDQRRIVFGFNRRFGTRKR